MKITKRQLKQIIKEELENLNEGRVPSLVAVLRDYYPDQLAALQSAVAQVDKTVKVLDDEMLRWEPRFEPDEDVRKASSALNHAVERANKSTGSDVQSFMDAARKANKSEPPPALQEDEDIAE